MTAQDDTQGTDLGAWDAFEALPIQVWTARPDGVLDYISQRTAAYYGLPSETLLLSGWQSVVHPSDLPEATKTWTRSLETGEPYFVEFRLRRDDGAYLWHTATAIPLRDQAGHITRWVGSCNDISAHKAAEENLLAERQRYLDLVNSTEGIVWEADAVTLAFTFVSERAQRLLGYPTARWLEPNFWVDHLHPDDRDAAVQGCKASTEAMEPHQLDYRMIAADGRVVWLEDRVSVLVEGGVAILLRGVLVDITERKVAEASKQALMEQVRESQKMQSLGALAGGIAHDFNNLLGAIRGNVDLAHESLGDVDTVKECLTEVGSAVHRASELVQQILTFSRKKAPELRLVDLGAVVEEAARFLRASAPPGTELEVITDPSTPAVNADATQLHQIVMNLGANAWRALRDAGLREGCRGRILVEVEKVELDAGEARELSADLPEGTYACLSISDNGVGMDDETRARIFEPFFTTRSGGDGTGLGLAVVHGIVAAHRGAINVGSKVSEGSVFRIYIPEATEPLPSKRRPSVGLRHSPHGSDSRGHVLLVDDEPQIVRFTTRALELHGFRVTAHTDPRAARDALRSAPDSIDLLITDVTMPHVSGLELAQDAIAQRPDLPVILVTGALTSEVARQARTIGITRVLQKPIAIQELRALVSEVLAERRTT